MTDDILIGVGLLFFFSVVAYIVVRRLRGLFAWLP